MAKTVDEGRGRGDTAAIAELAGRTDEDVTLDRSDVSDGLGAKVRSRPWLLLLSGAAPPLGNVDVIGDGSAWDDGEVAFDLICVNETATVVSTVEDSAASIPSQVFVLPVVLPSPRPSPPPPAPSITPTSF